MCVHVFGNTPSPAVATYGLRRTVQSADEDVKQFVKKNFYVDDALTSVENAQEAICLLQKTKDALESEGNLRLHKISSNHREVIEAFPKEELSKELKNMDIREDILPQQHSLGLAWNLDTDIFKFKIQESQLEKPYTRRGLLSAIGSIFDPMGMLSPVTIQGKILLRELTSNGADWDEPLPVDKKDKWESLKQTWRAINEMCIPRMMVRTSLKDAVRRELHVFSDASEKAIASVAYIKVLDTDGHIGFVLGKAKVAPSHGNTIPRLELCAALLSIEIAEFIHEHIDLQFDQVKFYTDSKVVLGYVRNETRRFHTYVCNRVAKIRQHSQPQQWQYVPTDKNPADVATRGNCDVFANNDVWLSGPSQLLRSEPSSTQEDYCLIDPDADKEIRSDVMVNKTTITNQTDILEVKRFERFSSWTKLVGAIYQLKRFVQSQPQMNPVDLRKDSERFIIRSVQYDSYASDIIQLQAGRPVTKGSPIEKLSPFLDTDGLLRVGGRLSESSLTSKEKHLLIVPGTSWSARLLALHFHEGVQHQGRHITEGAIRSAGFWVVGGKRLISSLLHKCVKCRKLRRPCESQKMADLPSERVTPGAPFSSVGVDTFGPWQVVARKTRGGQANCKRWAVVFTCLTTRAVHIEVVEDLSSSSFINAVRRFTAIRGKVALFRSDRGTNFVGATDALRIDAIKVEDGPVKDYLYNSGCTWIFNTPHASHMGGVWERVIGMVRRILDSMLRDIPPRTLTHEVLTTFMAEVCAILNSRPITPVSSDPECPEVLSPAMLLTQKSDVVPVPSGEFELPDLYKAQWRRVQHLASVFWNRWRRDYLQLLQNRRKWTDNKPNIKVGDVVLISDKSAHRNDWPIAKVTSVFPSNDEIVRKVELKCCKDNKRTVSVRPVTEIVLLLGQ